MPYPNVAREQLLGGHAVAIVGRDEKRDMYKVRNSWGTDWGLHGYFKMPAAFLLNPQLASDFWIVTKMETGI